MASSPATVAVALPRPLLSRRARELATGYLYLLPVAICLGGTIVFPILKAMHMSLYNHVLFKPQEYRFIGLGNYARLLHDETFWLTLELHGVGLRIGHLPVPRRLRGGAAAPPELPGPRVRPYGHLAAVDRARRGGGAGLGVALPAELRRHQRSPAATGLAQGSRGVAVRSRAGHARRGCHPRVAT